MKKFLELNKDPSEYLREYSRKYGIEKYQEEMKYISQEKDWCTAMEIRKARETDLDNIAELYIANWKETYKGLLPDEYLDSLDLPYGKGKWSSFLKEDGNHILVAEEDSRFLGFGAFTPDCEIDDCLLVYSLHVCPKARGKGVGSALLAAIAEYAADSNFERMSICIVCGNDGAGNLYRKLGAEHYAYFTDDFNGTKSNSEKLVWNTLT